MATHVVTSLVDDFDGSDAVETISFSFNGHEYRIDLNEKNAAKLHKTFAPFVEKAQKIGKTGKKGHRMVVAAQRGPGELAEIRAWATENGHQVAERGRLSAAVMEAYQAANG